MPDPHGGMTELEFFLVTMILVALVLLTLAIGAAIG